jgi:hypothetical protein
MAPAAVMASTPGLGSLREAHDLQRVKHGGMDAGDLGLGQWIVLSARKSGAHGALVLGQRGGAERDARRAATATAGLLEFDFGGHIRTLSDLGSYSGARLAFAACRTPATSIS